MLGVKAVCGQSRIGSEGAGVFFLEVAVDFRPWRTANRFYNGKVLMHGMGVFRRVLFIFGDCSGSGLFVVFLEQECMFADCCGSG